MMKLVFESCRYGVGQRSVGFLLYRVLVFPDFQSSTTFRENMKTYPGPEVNDQAPGVRSNKELSQTGPLIKDSPASFYSIDN